MPSLPKYDINNLKVCCIIGLVWKNIRNFVAEIDNYQ